MSTVVLLSDSPPRTFARSPTSADSSPYLPSPSELFRGEAHSPKRFKSNVTTRDGFNGGFSSARSLMAVKHGAENLPLRSPCREKFKPLTVSSQSPKPRFSTQSTSQKKASEQPESKAVARNSKKSSSKAANKEAIHTAQALPDDIHKQNIPSPGPAPLSLALPRRTDWTPLKEDTRNAVIDSDVVKDVSTSFPNGLMASFGLGEPMQPDRRLQQDDTDILKPVKRWKVELVEAHPSRGESLEEAVMKIQNQVKPAIKKRTKSPDKKPMTITHLATSRYFGKAETNKASPMMQYLTSTQAREIEIADIDNIEVLSKTVKQRSKKPPTKKGRPSRSRLLSPKSVMQSLDTQETVFGSASQLVQDQSVTMETNPPSDLSSPERTQAISIASTTPRASRGTSRFVRTRNLWSAAGRDEENALLHIETVDLFETPCMKNAFAGKDALVAPAQSNNRSRAHFPHSTTFSFMAGNSPLSAVRRANVLDVDDLQSPLSGTVMRARAIHSTTNVSRADPVVTAEETEQGLPQNRKRVSAADAKQKPKVPHKPSYAGLETSALQKQIKSFGFKPVKGRPKMIELLEMCWEARHGKQEEAPEATDDPLKHGDFLSKVHDISSRPEPKSKKPRKRTKAQADGVSPVKQTKRPKKANSTANETPKEPKVKKPRKSRSKMAALSEEVVDMDAEDDIETAAPRLPPVTDEKTTVRVPTPPPSLPPIENDTLSAQGGGLFARDLAHAIAPGQDLGDQIQAAVLQQSEDAQHGSRNHVRDPTWHEKILMYDPITIEELTAWLNTEGLNKVNEDREVSTLDVRAWCESKGICCLWKGGWRGQKSKATED